MRICIMSFTQGCGTGRGLISFILLAGIVKFTDCCSFDRQMSLGLLRDFQKWEECVIYSDAMVAASGQSSPLSILVGLALSTKFLRMTIVIALYL